MTAFKRSAIPINSATTGFDVAGVAPTAFVRVCVKPGAIRILGTKPVMFSDARNA